MVPLTLLTPPPRLTLAPHPPLLHPGLYIYTVYEEGRSCCSLYGGGSSCSSLYEGDTIHLYDDDEVQSYCNVGTWERIRDTYKVQGAIMIIWEKHLFWPFLYLGSRWLELITFTNIFRQNEDNLTRFHEFPHYGAMMGSQNTMM